MSDAALLEEWRRMHDLPKVVFGWPDWQTILPHRTLGPVQHASHQSARRRLVVTLADADGSSLEGVQLRLTSGLIVASEVNVTFEIQHQNEWICIARLDIWPNGPHHNKHWRRLGEEPEVHGSHHHPFSQNSRLGRSNFKPHSNLDSATKIDPEPNSFRDILKSIERFWNIRGASLLPLPELQESLL